MRFSILIRQFLSPSVVLLMVYWLTGCQNVDKEIPAPTIYMNMPQGGYEMEVNDTLLLEPKIVYDYNSTYQWIENGMVIYEKRDLELIPQKHETRDILFKIDNPQGSDQYEVRVGVIILSNFEKFVLKENTVVFDAATAGAFSDRIVLYPNQADLVKKNWNGYAISNRVSSTKSDSTAIFHVNASSGSAKSKNFGIYHYQPDVKNHIVFADKKAHHLKSIDICNNLFTAQVAKFGFEKTGIEKFVKGDWLEVEITAYDAQGGLVGSKKEVLVDYRPEKSTDYVILSSWKTVDLSAFDGVASIDLIMKSSKADTPTYICVDNLKLFK